MFKKFLYIILILASLCLIGCQPNPPKPTPHPCPPYHQNKRPETFVTNYIEEEHVNRLNEIAKYIYLRNTNFHTNTLLDYKAYIVYSYDERPENFYITLEWKNPVKYRDEDKQYKETNFTHVVGYIENDEYYVLDDYLLGFRYGKGFWAEYNVLDKKKYCTLLNNYGYIDDNGELVVYKKNFDYYEYGYTKYYLITYDVNKERFIGDAEEERYMLKSRYFFDVKRRPETFTSQYCEAEHKERIRQSAIAFYDYHNLGNNFTIEHEVYLVYSYDERPEMFYVITRWLNPLTYKDSFGEKQQTEYSHIIGYIENDEYYTIGDYEDRYRVGKGFWADQNALHLKKYATLNDYLGYVTEEGELVVYAEKEQVGTEDYYRRPLLYEQVQSVNKENLINLTNEELRIFSKKFGEKE